MTTNTKTANIIANAAFRIESRIPGQTPWALEDGEVYATEDAAERVIETLESENDDGELLEYRVVPA